MGVRVREKVKGSGFYWIFINRNNQRRSMCIGPRPQAEAVAVEVRRLLGLADLRASGQSDLSAVLAQSVSVFAEPARASVTVAEYAKEWQAANAVPGGWAHTTAMHYRYMLDNHVLPGWGSIRLQDVSRRAVKAWASSLLRKGLQHSSAVTVIRVFRAMLSAAEDDDLIEANPIRGVTRVLPKVRQEEKPKRAYTPAQLRRVLRAAEAVSEGDDNRYLPLVLMAETGVRISEALGIRWRDIDTRTGVITIRRQYVKGKETPTKSRATRRTAITPELVARLRRLRSGNAQASLSKAREQDDRVFQNTRGKGFKRSRVGDLWLRAVKRAGVPDYKPHGLRHTWISNALLSGMTVKEVGQRVGHSSAYVTTNYEHVLERAELVPFSPAMVDSA